jgi:formate C-acetyltransferase
VQNTFVKRKADIINARDFDGFYAIYEEELTSDLWEAEKISKAFQEVRSRDTHLVSNIFLEGPIKNGKSCTRGGLDRYIAVGLPVGLTTVIDSLTAVAQFVFEEKLITMEELCEALENNWKGFKTLRATIIKKCRYFGNNDPLSDCIAQRLFGSIAKWNNTDNYLGKKWLFGNLIGYNEHNKFFGDATMATPDGRFAGDPVSFGIGQSEGRDREGLTALLTSIATCDPEAVLTGPSVTNVLIEEELVKNDDLFEKTVDLFESYFRMGGTHFQLTYVSKEELLDAKSHPEKHKSLRVRVSGFSDYFNLLNGNLQDEIITRTVQK